MLKTIVATDRDERRVSRRDARYEAQRVLWRLTEQKRLAYCGRVVASSDGVEIMGGDGVAGFSGLQSCGSVWACPVCSEKVNAARQSDLENGIRNWMDEGHAVVFGTFTMRHNRRQTLAELWDAVGPAWNETTSRSTAWRGGRRQIGDKERFGVGGYTRLVEVKHGDNGWHVHLHVLFFLDAELSTSQLEDFRLRMFGRWETALAKRGLRVLDRAQDGSTVGVDFRPVKDADYIADYMAKNNYRPRGTSASGAAYEVTGSQSKKAGKGGRTPFEILADLAAPGVSELNRSTGEIIERMSPAQLIDLMIWREWEKDSSGRRQLTWSRGLRDRLGLVQRELTDEEVVQTPDSTALPLCTLSVLEWKAGRWAYRREELLKWAENGELGYRIELWRGSRVDRECLGYYDRLE